MYKKLKDEKAPMLHDSVGSLITPERLMNDSNLLLIKEMAAYYEWDCDFGKYGRKRKVALRIFLSRSDITLIDEGTIMAFGLLFSGCYKDLSSFAREIYKGYLSMGTDLLKYFTYLDKSTDWESVAYDLLRDGEFVAANSSNEADSDYKDHTFIFSSFIQEVVDANFEQYNAKYNNIGEEGKLATEQRVLYDYDFLPTLAAEFNWDLSSIQSDIHSARAFRMYIAYVRIPIDRDTVRSFNSLYISTYGNTEEFARDFIDQDSKGRNEEVLPVVMIDNVAYTDFKSIAKNLEYTDRVFYLQDNYIDKVHVFMVNNVYYEGYTYK